MEVKASDLFAAGTRIIGILALIKGIQVSIMTAPSVFGLFGQNYPGWAMSQQIITLIYPLALLIIGIYLLKDTSRLVRKFYPGEEETAIDSAKDTFQLAMKITGMVLIVYGVPELLRILSNFLYMGYYCSFGIDMFEQQMLVTEKTLAVLVSLLFGFYLLYGGRFFSNIAFKD